MAHIHIMQLISEYGPSALTEHNVLMAMSRFAAVAPGEHEFVCWPSIETLAQVSRVGPTAVKAAVKALEAKGLVSTYRTRGRKSNTYTLHLAGLLESARDAGHKAASIFTCVYHGHEVTLKDDATDNGTPGSCGYRPPRVRQEKPVTQSPLESRLESLERALQLVAESLNIDLTVKSPIKSGHPESPNKRKNLKHTHTSVYAASASAGGCAPAREGAPDSFNEHAERGESQLVEQAPVSSLVIKKEKNGIKQESALAGFFAAAPAEDVPRSDATFTRGERLPSPATIIAPDPKTHTTGLPIDQQPKDDDHLEDLGHGLKYDPERRILRHAAFTLSVAAVAMQFTMTPILAGHDPEIAAKSSALQWAVQLESGAKKHETVPGNAVGAIVSSAMRRAQSQDQHEWRKKIDKQRTDGAKKVDPKMQFGTYVAGKSCEY